MSDQTLSGLSLSHFSAGYPRRKVIENLTVPHLPRENHRAAGAKRQR
jgi:iron complex transport system ATP-binding protein